MFLIKMSNKHFDGKHDGEKSPNKFISNKKVPLKAFDFSDYS